jgi:hypothetical protein
MNERQEIFCLSFYSSLIPPPSSLRSPVITEDHEPLLTFYLSTFTFLLLPL